jgi:hypothetical protein
VETPSQIVSSISSTNLLLQCLSIFWIDFKNDSPEKHKDNNKRNNKDGDIKTTSTAAMLEDHNKRHDNLLVTTNATRRVLRPPCNDKLDKTSMKNSLQQQTQQVEPNDLPCDDKINKTRQDEHDDLHYDDKS